MIFTCFPPQGKCEWANLIGFVREYNRMYNKAYVRAACLDVEEHNSKEPEVLLEAPGGISIVIERKAVVWPRHYFSDHANMHDFLKLFNAVMDDRFRDSLYQLMVTPDSLNGKTKRQIKDDAEQLAAIVMANQTSARSSVGIGQDKPTWWRFRPLSIYERADFAPNAAGVGINVMESVWSIWSSDDSQEDYEVVEAGYSGEFERAASAAVEKFTNYGDHLKLLLVQFDGEGGSVLEDEDEISIIQSAGLPERIDQVWLARHEWVNASDFEVAWERAR